MNLLRMLQLFFSPDDGGGLGVISDIKELQDIENKDEDKDEDKDDKEDDEGEGKEKDKEDKDGDKEDKDSDKGDEEDEDKEEVEKEEEGEKEEDEEEVDKVEVVGAAEIKKAYPDFFKKFPEVRAAIYRDQQYGEIFGSPKDAEVAAQRSNLLGEIEKDIIEEGNPEKLLKAVATANKESYQKIAFRILPFLQESDKELYYQVASTPIKQLLRAAWREGNGTKTDLGRAAAYIHKYFFGDYEFDGKTKAELGVTDKEEPAEKKEYRERLQQIDQREFDNFARSVDTSYIAKMSGFIRESLDKDERLSEYAKVKLTEDILVSVRRQLEKDPRHVNQVKSLFKQAKLADYSSDFKSRIVSASLARAKSLVPSLRTKLVAEALGKKTNGKEKEEEKEEKVGRREGRRESSFSSRRERNEQPKRPLTDIEILRAR